MAQVKVERKLRNEADLVEVKEITGTEPILIESPIEFGGNLEVDGKLTVNDTLQVGNVTVDDEELAKLPRALVLPISSPTEQELVGIDTSNEQNRIKLSNDFIVKNGVLEPNTTIENLIFDDTNTEASGMNISYASVTEHAGKLNVVVTGEFTRTEEIVYNPSIGGIGLPSRILEKLIPLQSTAFSNVLSVSDLVFLDTETSTRNNVVTVSFPLMVEKYSASIGLQLFGMGVDTRFALNRKYYFRCELSFSLSDNLVGE